MSAKLPDRSKSAKWEKIGTRSKGHRVSPCLDTLSALFDEMATGRLKVIFTYARARHSDNAFGNWPSPVQKGQFKIAERSMLRIGSTSQSFDLELINDAHNKSKNALAYERRKHLMQIAGQQGGSVRFSYNASNAHTLLADYLAGYFAHTFNGFEKAESDFTATNEQVISHKKIVARNTVVSEVDFMLFDKLGLLVNHNKPGSFEEATITFQNPEAETWEELPIIESMEVTPPK